jgi:putative Ca2+/H+ antiporter (TMEM165/GDT1 family)
LKAFWLTFWLIFLAEMGDKTQFIAFSYAARYRLRHVLIGIGWSTALVFLFSVLLGRVIGAHIPEAYVQAISAACFLGFALWTLRGEEEHTQVKYSWRHPIMIVGATFLLAEFGDKTMLATVVLAASHGWLPVWLGSVAAMVSADGMAVGIGRQLGKQIPEIHLKWITAAAFFAFALWSAVVAYRSFAI